MAAIHSSSQLLRIAIIGGGPGGLTLARVLQKHGVRATVFERERSANSRSQGGSLDLHGESGLKALRVAGLFGEFLKCARYEGEQMRVIDKSGIVHLDEEGPMGPPEEAGENYQGRPEIDRTDLRRILLNSLDDGTVQWGCKLKTITPLTGELSGQHKLIFENSREETADFVVGADGAWSVVRPLLSPAKPMYSSISFIDLSISAVDSRYPSVAALVGQGLTFIVSDNKGLIAQRNSGGIVKVYVALRVAEGWMDEFEGKFLPHGHVDTKHALDAITALFPGWAPELLDLLRFSDPEPIVPRKIYMLPIPHTWPTRRGLTLLGDAAHLMSPFAGEGVNLAMIDAADLGLALSDVSKFAGDGSSQFAELLEDTIRKYEGTMCGRGAEMAKESAENLDLIFSTDAPKPFLDRMAFYHSQGEGGQH